MKRPDWLKQAVLAGGAYHALKQDPTRHNLLNGAVLVVWLALYPAVLSLAAVLPWWGYLLVGPPLLGVLTYGLFVLVIHECSHSMFLLFADRERQKRANAVIGRVFGEILMTDYVRHWEEGHVTHHLKPCEDVDPQNPDPRDGKRLLAWLVGLLVPGFVLYTNPSRQYGVSIRRLVLGLGFWTLVGVAAGTAFGWPAGVGIVMMFNCTNMLSLLKIAQEHGSGLGSEPDPLYRSRTYHYPLARVMSPFNINYHWEHHANFNVPWYLLPAYHREVRRIMPAALHPYFFTVGAGEYLRQASGTKALPSGDLRQLMSA